MKKTLLFTFFIIISIGCYAQTISYGFDAGLTLTRLPNKITLINVSDNQTTPINDKYLLGFHAGGLIDIKFKTFSIQPGISFITKGDQIGDSSPSTNIGKLKTVLDYIEIPVNLLYRINAGKGDLFVGGGPYIAFGITGKETANYYENGQYQQTSMTDKFGSPGLNTPDYGINALAGYKLDNGFLISGGYGLGLKPVYRVYNTAKNQGFSLSLGYFFK